MGYVMRYARAAASQHFGCLCVSVIYKAAHKFIDLPELIRNCYRDAQIGSISGGREPEMLFHSTQSLCEAPIFLICHTLVLEKIEQYFYF